MTELNFKGKEFVYNHHLSVPIRPLEMHADKGIGDPSLDGNLIIQGDNLHALKALLPMYAGKVDCIFVDPPYNTGRKDWSYNDNVNAPMIKEWLTANPIGIDDSLRHDKWCAMMYPRLRLLWELMSEDAVVFVCIDDNELCHLRILLDEISGTPDNWVGTIVWKNVTDNNPTRIAIEHEYIVCFAKNKANLEKVWKSRFSDVKNALAKVGADLLKEYAGNEVLMQAAYTKWFKRRKSELWPLDRYKFIDAGGVYTGSQSVHNPGKEGYRYDVLHPVTGKPCKQPLMGYRFPPDTMDELLASDRIIFGDTEEKIIELKVYAHDYADKLPSVIELDGRTAAYELRQLFPERTKAFDTPKTTQLVDSILSFVTKEGSIVLDSFAGSGTTAHSVLNLVAQDKMERQFILVEGEGYADDLTAERVRRVIRGVDNEDGTRSFEGLGGSFTYCTLGDPIELDAILTGESLPGWEGLGRILFHMATSRPLDAGAMDKDKFYLGTHSGTHVWLIYKPDLEWLKSPEAALKLSFARKMAEGAPNDRHIVFAPARHVSQKMLADQGLPVEFAPLPFALYRLERE